MQARAPFVGFELTSVPGSAPGDRLTRSPEVAFSDLHEVPLIQPGPGASRQSLEETARKMSVRLNVIAEVDSLDLMKRLVAQRGGYALLLELSISDDVQAGRLSAAKVISPEMVGHVCLVRAPGKSGDRAAREIALLVRQVAMDAGHLRGWTLPVAEAGSRYLL